MPTAREPWRKKFLGLKPWDRRWSSVMRVGVWQGDLHYLIIDPRLRVPKD